MSSKVSGGSENTANLFNLKIGPCRTFSEEGIIDKNNVTLQGCHSTRSFDFFFITTWPLIRLILLHYRWLLNLCFFFYIVFSLEAEKNTSSLCTLWPVRLLWMPAVALHFATLPPWAHCSYISIQKNILYHWHRIWLQSANLSFIHLLPKIKANKKTLYSAHVNLVFEKWKKKNYLHRAESTQ